MNGDEVRDTWFAEPGNLGGGYDASAVDDLLRRVADALDAGQPAGPLIENATFQVVRGQDPLVRAAVGWRQAGRRRYDIDAVDWFFAQLLRRQDYFEVAGTSADPWRDLAVVNQFTLARPGHLAKPSAQPSWRAHRKSLAEARNYVSEECARAWRDFGQQPGRYLKWGEVGWRRYELRTAERQTIASLHQPMTHDGRLPKRASLSTGGRKFTLAAPSARSWSPAVAEIVARSRRDHAGHFAAESVKNAVQRTEARRVRELVDETRAPILYLTGRNFEYRACARVTFPDQRWLRFLVRPAVMTAVDQAGNKVARYRINRGLVEITLHPDRALTDELALAIAISAPWLGSYSESSGGGG